MRHQRWILISFIVAAMLVGSTVQAAAVSAFAQFAIPDQRLGPVTTTSALSLVLAVGTFAALMRNVKAVALWDEVIDELSRVTWPTKDETIRASTTVVVTTLIVAAILGVYDYLWKNLADLVLFNTPPT